MQMYPAYKLPDVLNEYAISFFRLLNEGYRIKFNDLRTLANIAMAPETSNESWQKFIESLDYASSGVSAMLEPDEDETTLDKIKEIF